MKAHEFCYWLQGYFELAPDGQGLNAKQLECVRAHLALVFKHEIDQKYGDEEHQNELNAIHNPVSGPSSNLGGPTFRC